MCQAFRFDSCCSCCRAVFGREALDFSSEISAAIVAVCEIDFGYLEFIANCSIFVRVHGCLFKAIATKCLVAASVE